MPANVNWNDIPTIDSGILAPLSEVLEESIHDVINEFLTDTPRISDEIKSALNNGEYMVVAGLVHQLRSSSGSLGGLRVQELSSWIEKLASGGDEQEIRQNCELLFSAIDELLEALRKFQSDLRA